MKILWHSIPEVINNIPKKKNVRIDNLSGFSFQEKDEKETKFQVG